MLGGIILGGLRLAHIITMLQQVDARVGQRLGNLVAHARRAVLAHVAGPRIEHNADHQQPPGRSTIGWVKG